MYWFCHTFTWISHGCTCIPHPEPPVHLPPHSIPLGLPSAPTLSTLSHASNLDWLSVSHMIIYMFQHYPLKSSHPRLLPQSPKDYSLYLCLFCCLSYRVIITIFLNFTYICWYTVLVFFFLTYFTLYSRLQFHQPHSNWFKCILFTGWIIFYCVYVPQLSYPFICQWTSRLFPCPDLNPPFLKSNITFKEW